MSFTSNQPTAGTTPAFSFGLASAPPFGATGSGMAKTASTPLFGASMPGFGAVPATGLFGSTSTPTFSFAGTQPAQTQPSLFGASQPAAAPAASPFGGFGAAPASQPAMGFFGQLQTVPPQQPQQQQQASLQPVPDDSALRELQGIKDAFVPGPGNHRFRFRHLFLNVVDNPAARVKPPDVDELAWREALRRAGGPDNAARLWPVQAQGFGDLLRRKAAQDEAIREHTQRLEALQQAVARLASRHEAVLREQLEAIKRRHAAMRQHLLRVLRYIDALEGRFVHAMGYRSATPRDVLHRLSSQLQRVEGAVGPDGAGGMPAKAEALLAAARLQAGGATGGPGAGLDGSMDAASLEAVFAILSGYAEALGKMQGVMQRDRRDVAVLLAESGNAGGGR